jgi:peroxiredoxin
VAGCLHSFEAPDDWRNKKCELKFWSVDSGEEILSIPPAEKSEVFMWIKTSPDGRTVVATTYDLEQGRGRVLLVDVPTRSTKVVVFDATQMPREPVFHPGGQWVAVGAQILPPGKLTREPAAGALAQPRIRLIEVASGKTLEELVAPQCYLNSLAFSPDGKTLATSGPGEVLLWDFRVPPGRLGAAPQVGQAFKIEGTTLGGKPLDAGALKDKVVLVSFWATWCTPCVAELPELASLYGRFRERGFDVVGVSLDDDRAALEKFVESRSLPWPILCGASAEESGLRHPLAVKYAVDSVPKFFLLDRQGRVAAIDPGVGQLPELVEKLLAAPEARQAD